MRTKLATLQKGSDALDSAYKDALDRIDGQLPGHRDLARRALSWITYAQRPLTGNELRHALAIELGESALDTDNMDNLEEIISVCAGLITVDQESSTIRLVHYTTQEYFERIHSDWNPAAQEEIAVACLTYLSFDIFKSGSCASDEAFEQRLAQNEFFDYSAQYWNEHIRPIQANTADLALAFLHDQALVDSTCQCAFATKHKYSGYTQCFPRQSSGLHLAAKYGLLELIERLLMDNNARTNIIADSKNGDGRTPLSLAAGGGHVAVVQFFIDREDIDINSRDWNGRTPLAFSAEQGYTNVVQLLIKRRDIEADPKDKYGQTPLSLAAQNGHKALMQLLIEREDIDTDLGDEHHRTPLSLAAENGHEAVVRLLVQRQDVDIDSKDKYGRAPLWWAAFREHRDIVHLLLERGDVDAGSMAEIHRSPRSWAVRSGHQRVKRGVGGKLEFEVRLW